MKDVAACYLALSNPTRRRLLDAMRRGPRTVGELAAEVTVTRPAVSQHLKLLQELDLVSEQWHGTRHIFRLNPSKLARLRADLDRFWEDALTSFASHANNPERK